MSSNQFTEDALVRHQIYLQRYAAGAGNQVAELLDILSEEIQSRIAAGGTEFTVGNLRRIQDQLPAMIAQLDMPTKIYGPAEDLAKSEIGYFEKLITTATTADLATIATESIFATLSVKPMLLTSASGKVTRMTIEELVERFVGHVDRQIINRLRTGIALGETSEQLAASLSRMVEKRTRFQARAVARTIINHVGAEARSFATLANQDIFEGEEYVATLDSRTTFICASLDGDIFPIGVGPQPPLHYNCRSLRVPKIKPEYNIKGLDGVRPAVSLTEEGKRDISQVSTQTKFSGWFSRQPTHFQKDYLGPNRYELYKSGKIKLDQFTEETGRVLTLKELEALF